MSMPGVYDCIIKRHPTLDPSRVESTEQQPVQVDKCPQDQENMRVWRV